jgi:hypothetical protein
VTPETKNNLKGSQDLKDYILLYSGVPTNTRAAAVRAIVFKIKFKKIIHSYTFIDERSL